MIVQHDVKQEAAAFYADNDAHLADELRKLDLLIEQRVLAFHLRSQAMSAASDSQQMYISHEEVDWLLQDHESIVSEHESSAFAEISTHLQRLQDTINAQVTESLAQGVFLALPQLAHLFALSPFEVQTVIVCLAPELRRKYDQLYAYLQDDITRKRPSVDLVLDLLCMSESERWRARALFSSQAPLFRAGIVQTVEDPQSPSGSSGLARFLKVDERIFHYLLGTNSIDERLYGRVQVFSPLSSSHETFLDPVIKTKLLNLTDYYFAESTAAASKKLVVYIHGPYGVGKRDLALEICEKWQCMLLYLDMEIMLAYETDFVKLLRLAFRDGLLLQAALYIDNVDVVLKEDEKTKALLKQIAIVMVEYGWLLILAGEKQWPYHGLFESLVFQTIQLPVPDIPLREMAWNKALEILAIPDADISWARQLASRFRLTPGQIRDAVELAEKKRAERYGLKDITLDDLYIACHDQSNQKLGELALKVESHYGWEDIVLPDEKVTQLKEICSQVKHHYRVFGEWGFEHKLSHGKGLSVLFFGPSGTGKTMAAAVIAHELQLILYKVDLAGVVNKYIGETEKNLARIFQEAESSNAILFFDEADALFGKRTEVSDAHDRYANIETSYLLQKMETYEGIVILATNLRENMDEAFTRRIRFMVEFPFPDVISRQEIWKSHFPAKTPVSHGIDYERLSKQFEIAGGNIKNIVLNAAFLAAETGDAIEMDHLLQGTQREYEKIGKLWNEQDFIRPKH